MCGITKPVRFRDLQGPAGDLVGQAVFSFDRFSILGPWAMAGQQGWRAGRHTILLTYRGTKKDEAASIWGDHRIQTSQKRKRLGCVNTQRWDHAN